VRTVCLRLLPDSVAGGCDLNPGPSAPESSTLTTRLPSHPHSGAWYYWNGCVEWVEWTCASRYSVAGSQEASLRRTMQRLVPGLVDSSESHLWLPADSVMVSASGVEIFTRIYTCCYSCYLLLFCSLCLSFYIQKSLPR